MANNNPLIDALLQGIMRTGGLATSGLGYMKSQQANILDDQYGRDPINRIGPEVNFAPKNAPVQPLPTILPGGINIPQRIQEPISQAPVILPQEVAQPVPMDSEASKKTGILEILKNNADWLVPLVAAGVGIAGKGGPITAGAAGFAGGFNQGRQQAFENKLAREEQDRKNKLYGDGKSVHFIDPITGELKESANIGYRDQVFKGVLSPEQMKQRAIATGEAEFTRENMKQSGKLGTAIKRLALLNRQYAKALPSGDRTPLEQRFLGGAESWAAKRGLVDNPELVALQKNIRPMAINLIRAFGEVGNLSESEQKGAIETVDLPTLTDQERIAQTKQFIEFALAGANPEGINMLASNQDMRGILDAFGIDLSQFSNNFSLAPSGDSNNKIGRFIVEAE